jgi:hypothetical protein
MGIRSPQSALAWARGRRSFQSGMCLKFVRTCYNVPPLHASAAIAWNKSRFRHSSTPPKGVPVWWTGGSRGFGHVAISDGGGFVISTDSGGKGRVGRTTISHITRAWHQTYRGWTEDINGVRVFRAGSSAPAATAAPKKPARTPPRGRPTVSASAVANLFRRKQKHNAVLLIQKALAAEVGLDFSSGPGTPGPRTRAAYQKWQQRLGFRGNDADGIPGFTSLSRLGAKRGFGVTR